MSDWDRTTDFLIIGSGAGGLSAGLGARAAGGDTLIIEKQAKIGGSSALSGGTMWVPNNPLMQEEGVTDSIEAGLAYLDATVSDEGPATSRARKMKFLTESVRMIDFLRRVGIPVNRVRDYPDYYAELPGGSREGRALQCDMFDLSELGPYADLLVAPDRPVLAYIHEAPYLMLAFRTWRGLATTVRVLARTLRARVHRRPLAANGTALVGRLLRAAVESGVDLWTDCPFKEFVIEDGRVIGVLATRRGREVRIRARRGVLIAAGGYARNLAMRQRNSRTPASVDWTMASPGETGEVVEECVRLGAATDLMDEAIWMPMAVSPSGLKMVRERSLPHSMVVDGEGRRFVDESETYMAVGQAMYDGNQAGTSAIPSWLILEARHRRRYPLMMHVPGHTPSEWIKRGFVRRADSLEALATECGFQQDVFMDTVKRFNRFATVGTDEEFHRGETPYSRHLGDPAQRPNPSLGPIERAPFYAIEIYPGDLGTFGGIITDEHAQVLRADGSVIGGLYATGNATAPFTGRVYPSTGASIASTMVFGMIAAKHALDGYRSSKASMRVDPDV